MAEVRVTRTITAPPERVWPLLADPTRWPEWLPGITTSEVTAGPVEGVGRRQRLDAAYAGQHGEIELRITDWEPRRRIGWVHTAERIGGKQQNFAKDIRTIITLTPAGTGTELQVEGSWEPVGIMGKMLGKTLVQSRAEGMLGGAAENLERLAREGSRG
ncbi:MAG: SRPBCC family protein [Gemmatimonadota bacterium]